MSLQPEVKLDSGAPLQFNVDERLGEASLPEEKIEVTRL
jgi:hypothetical protein